MYERGCYFVDAILNGSEKAMGPCAHLHRCLCESIIVSCKHYKGKNGSSEIYLSYYSKSVEELEIESRGMTLSSLPRPLGQEFFNCCACWFAENRLTMCLYANGNNKSKKNGASFSLHYQLLTFIKLVKEAG